MLRFFKGLWWLLAGSFYDPLKYRPHSDSPLWMAFAYSELGTKEAPGAENNSVIIEYHGKTKLKATLDSVPWCAAFVCWCLEAAGVQSTMSARAKDYLDWGVLAKIPQEGSICVFERDGGGGHVGFYVGENKTHVFVLGGNQNNEVNISPYPKSRLICFRDPKPQVPLQLV